MSRPNSSGKFLPSGRKSRQQSGKKRAVAVVEEIMPIETIKPGDAVHFPNKGDSCLVHYTGYLENGEVFDCSYTRDRPICIVVGKDQVIQGWDDVLQRMSRGQKGRVHIPPEYAYGERGFPPIIPPMSTLTYEIELISFSPPRSADMLQRDIAES